MGSSSPPPPPPPHCLLITLTLLFLTLSRALPATALKGVDLGNPTIAVNPSLLIGRLPISSNSKDALYCERVKVSGHSRLELGSYPSSFRVTLVPATVIPERLHGKIQVCFHRNASLGLCHCEKDEWKAVQKGLWSSVMSPYEERYVDVKFTGEISGSVTIAVQEDSQQWRLLCLAVGFLLLLLAPILSCWVPFYYSTSMTIGVLVVVIIILFQGMKLLPTGRKNIFYLSIYGSVLGVSTFVLHHISMLVNSILINFGLSKGMHNPVYVSVLVGIVLAGAALGYWIVRKFVISKDGNVDVGVAQFVKWSMRIIATIFILQSTVDAPFAMAALLSSYAICFLINATSRRHQVMSKSPIEQLPSNNLLFTRYSSANDAEQLVLQYMEDLNRCKLKKRAYGRVTSSTPVLDSKNLGHACVRSSTPMPAFESPGNETCSSLRNTGTPVPQSVYPC
ncbi:uncharacterized protein LOC105632703 [Jatropha curcas]|uniref:uncharacterized protein LOC105632703 n=1 Tax=Jatropha curcas TaxID=180498 RepID=UPI0009D7666F|nr:uncharacterized protein LOC105632703 [Jatropha curcas]